VRERCRATTISDIARIWALSAQLAAPAGDCAGDCRRDECDGEDHDGGGRIGRNFTRAPGNQGE
jgi:hypothetical protein